MAKHNTYLVAVEAGLATEDMTFQTISEPEAAAIAVLKDRSTSLKVRLFIKECTGADYGRLVTAMW